MRKEYYIRVMDEDGDSWEHSVYADKQECIKSLWELKKSPIYYAAAYEREVKEEASHDHP